MSRLKLLTKKFRRKKLMGNPISNWWNQQGGAAQQAGQLGAATQQASQGIQQSQLSQIGAAQQQAALQQMSQITYSGTVIQANPLAPHGVAYGVAYATLNGQVVANPANMSPDQIEEINRQALDAKKAQFLKHPAVNRDAFIQHLRARSVSEDMEAPGVFGTQRHGYQVIYNGSGGLISWMPQEVKVTLEQFETWHADALLDKILEE
jgi:hypothetical protein